MICKDIARTTSAPRWLDFDGDGRPDLVTWDRLGTLTFYSDYRNQPGAFVGRTNLVFNNLTNTYEGARLGRGGLVNNTLAAADLDGNNVPELLVGTQAGGVVSFRVTNQTGVLNTRPSAAAASALALQLYPNPARGAVTVETATPTRLTVLDLVGKTVRREAALRIRHEVSLEGLAAGILPGAGRE